ncbi:glycosyl hydrolase [Polaribacter sp. R77954]|uniref:glycosyl hydrolase n=1 Tax=Polaribacter sp. R77954 TaxID=3093870 RepID=UPI0037C5F120
MKFNKFEPKNGKVLFFIGKDLEAVGGLKNYHNGYLDAFKIPAGITAYTNLSPGDNSFGWQINGLDGTKTKANWGAGDTCLQYYLDDKKFKNTMISIGLSMMNHDKNVAKGKHDKLIITLGEWIKTTKRPVFLRIGYEFDGWDWNNYEKKYFLKAWKRIHNIFRKIKVENVAFVWQSKGTGSNQEVLEEWYPGDEFVDWCGYSYFHNPDNEMITFARKHKKPVFIAEACPVLKDKLGNFYANLSNETEAKQIWQKWFVPFFKVINDHPDVVKAFSYINVEWKSQVMWQNNVYFKNVDSRIQQSDYITNKWNKEISESKYLQSTDSLFSNLNK